MKLVCFREGVSGFEPGDTVEVPDDTFTWDRVHFGVLEVGASHPTPTPSDEAALKAQLEAAEKDSDTGDSDSEDE